MDKKSSMEFKKTNQLDIRLTSDFIAMIRCLNEKMYSLNCTVCCIDDKMYS